MKTPTPRFTLLLLVLAAAFILPPTRAQAGSSLNKPDVVSASTTTTFPYNLVGRVSMKFAGVWYQGTGTVIEPSSVLTCAHNLWDPVSGFSTKVQFERALSEKSDPDVIYATVKFILGGYQTKCQTYGDTSPKAFARDLGGLRFATQPAAGNILGWEADTANLTDASGPWISLGYGAVHHPGDQILQVSPTAAYDEYLKGYFENYTYKIEGGMSGGPVLLSKGGTWIVTGVNVAGFHGGNGIRALDSTAQSFIQDNLE